ncbi:hypothetical protein [Psychromicrobium xiongbiense]|uniref:hypothetical protein n=1 Tax=Psychromicrobium xiongbiense TaxID=3051184 RepID=UPI002553B80F|nr:hypothetical protein [Psychromicrobium sp. YIM S02556]
MTEKPSTEQSAHSASKLSAELRESLERKKAQAAQRGAPGVAAGPKAVQASGKQGKREKKVRW